MNIFVKAVLCAFFLVSVAFVWIGMLQPEHETAANHWLKLDMAAGDERKVRVHDRYDGLAADVVRYAEAFDSLHDQSVAMADKLDERLETISVMTHPEEWTMLVGLRDESMNHLRTVMTERKTETDQAKTMVLATNELVHKRIHEASGAELAELDAKAMSMELAMRDLWSGLDDVWPLYARTLVLWRSRYGGNES